MDMMAMVSSLLAMQAGEYCRCRSQTSIMKSNSDAEKSAVLTLLGSRLAVHRQSRRRRWRQPQYYGLRFGRLPGAGASWFETPLRGSSP